VQGEQQRLLQLLRQQNAASVAMAESLGTMTQDAAEASTGGYRGLWVRICKCFISSVLSSDMCLLWNRMFH
jgi:hypothetical protein